MKQHKIAITKQQLKLEEKISKVLESVEFKKWFNLCETKIKTFKFYLIKLATNPKWHASYIGLNIIKNWHFKGIFDYNTPQLNMTNAFGRNVI